MGIGKTLFSHYRRHPLQLLSLFLVVLLATALWNGVWTLTQQARTSLAESKQALDARYQVVRADGDALSVQDFARLRRAGVCATPWLVVDQPAPAGRVIGVDPFSLACFEKAGKSGKQSLDGQPFLDISEARKRVAGNQDNGGGNLQILVSGPNQPVPPAYRVQAANGSISTGQLADSFLLNLNALCVLVLLITALLIRSVYTLGLNQRQGSLALLVRFGVTEGRLRLWLAGELLLISLVAIIPGAWLGLVLAGALADGFAQALSGLFDVQLLATGNALKSMLISASVVLLAVFWCLADTLLPALKSYAARLPIAGSGIVLIVAGFGAVSVAGSLAGVFLALAAIFLGAGLLTPRLLAGVAARLANRGVSPLQRWRWREIAVMVRKLALPVVALQFALATVIAIQALVSTFEGTFESWLDQRFQGDVYVKLPANASRTATEHWLRQQTALGPWYAVIRGRGQYQGHPVDALFLNADSPLLESWQFLAAIPSPWSRLKAPEAPSTRQGVMINEQLARRTGAQVGDTRAIKVGDKTVKRRVLAVYADYGRPSGEILLAHHDLPTDFKSTFTSFSIRLGGMSVETLKTGLARLWQVNDVDIRDNDTIRQLANQVFDQTFLLTRAISAMTLALATVCLLLMSIVFFNARRWYYQLLTIWGLSRRQVNRLLRKQAVALTGMIGLAALPLGIGLTWVLVDRINPLAFGWTLPMAVYPSFWLWLAMVCLIIGRVTGLLMQRQSRARVPPPVDAANLRDAPDRGGWS